MFQETTQPFGVGFGQVLVCLPVGSQLISFATWSPVKDAQWVVKRARIVLSASDGRDYGGRGQQRAQLDTVGKNVLNSTT